MSNNKELNLDELENVNGGISFELQSYFYKGKLYEVGQHIYFELNGENAEGDISRFIKYGMEVRVVVSITSGQSAGSSVEIGFDQVVQFFGMASN